MTLEAYPFSQIKEAIRTWFEVATGLPVVWENAPKKHHVRGTGYGKLSRPKSITSVGKDVLQFEDDPDIDNPNHLIPTVVGRRKASIICKVIIRNHTPLNDATEYTEKARLSIVKPSIVEHFQANGIAIVELRPTANFEKNSDSPEGDMESISAFELVFTYLSSDSDSSIGTIGSIGLSSTLKDTADVELSTPPNLDNEIIAETE